MKLTSSASEQNVFFTYVCLVDDLRPTEALSRDSQQHKLLNNHSNEVLQQEEPAIQVERTKAVHELVETLKTNSPNEPENHETDSCSPDPPTAFQEVSDSDNEDCNFISCDNPNVLKLTKMKWLTEDHENGPDSSSPSLSPATSSTSSCSKNSDCAVNKRDNYDDKYLSTILRLDKEHNMFGLSSIAIIGSRPSKQKRANKEDEKAVFHQTAIVQICCEKRCCNHMSKTDLPPSLKCGSCRSCCFDINCAYCARSAMCALTVCEPEPLPCPSICSTCPGPIGSCVCGSLPLPPAGGCRVDCTNYFGLKVKLNRKPHYEPAPAELTPRSSCILAKPAAARPCSHTPHCQPPSSCFPYLMPCYWPARPSAPCTHPNRCFHNPPCRAPRIRQRVPLPSVYKCPKKCEDKEKNTKCENEVCPGNIPAMKQEIESRFGKATQEHLTCCTIPKPKKKKRRRHKCECFRPTCASCFVTRPLPRPKGLPVLNLLCNQSEVNTVIEPSCSKCTQVYRLMAFNRCSCGAVYYYPM
ncbi:unnamed protein product [Arctia plantaginis]|uniref:Uncharacterized protein n=1 Tax=Arctia plantaginis TaxID=874455 RepID=A0A8S1AIA9_ARCPL|nr:unnamed protein product [Arctia plantaginis]